MPRPLPSQKTQTRHFVYRTWHPDHLHDLKAMVTVELDLHTTITEVIDLEKRGQICEPFGES